MNPHFAIESGKLVVRDESSRAVLWRGDFDGYQVVKILPLANTETCLVLLDPGGSTRPTFENLFLVNQSGAVHWKAKLPRTNDAFADVFMRGDHIEACTWQGIRVDLNAATGETKQIGFAK